MFAERKVEFGGTEEYCLGMGEFLEAPFAVIGSHAGVTGAVEGDTLYHQMQADFIYAASAVLLGGHDLLRPGFIGCEEIESQTMLAGCDEIQQFIFFGCFVRHHRKKRTEELVLNYILVGINRVDDRGFEAKSTGIAVPTDYDAVLIFLCSGLAFIVSIAVYKVRVFKVV